MAQKANRPATATSQPLPRRPHAGGFRLMSSDPVADLALAVALIAGGALIDWQIDTNMGLLAALEHGASPLPRLIFGASVLSAMIHLYRRRGCRSLALTAPAVLAPALFQLPLFYLCSEGHCI